MQTFLTANDVPYMGLNNIVCKNPVAYCKSHQIYLSCKDIELKKCLNKPTFDMISEQRCNNLTYV